jgi:glutamyl-tRNA synthetase
VAVEADFKAEFTAFQATTERSSRFRLAPTPSGYLHWGNALNFILNWSAARACGGKIVLRIDDLDADRKRPEFVQDIFDSLSWLGIDWDEGPQDTADFEANWSQHRRLSAYVEILEALKADHLLFACAKSRKDLEIFQGQYPLEFRDQGLNLQDTEVAWRVMTPRDFPLPDFVVRRRDDKPAYQISSIADDLHFGITHVIRGADLADSTLAQRWLAKQINADKFLNINFLHHPLILGDDGAKLSKSAGSNALKSMRDRKMDARLIWEHPLLAGIIGRQ